MVNSTHATPLCSPSYDIMIDLSGAVTVIPFSFRAAWSSRSRKYGEARRAGWMESVGKEMNDRVNGSQNVLEPAVAETGTR